MSSSLIQQFPSISSLSEWRIFQPYYQLNCSYIKGSSFLFIMFLHTPRKCSFTKVFTDIISAVLICFSLHARRYSTISYLTCPSDIFAILSPLFTLTTPGSSKRNNWNGMHCSTYPIKLFRSALVFKSKYAKIF